MKVCSIELTIYACFFHILYIYDQTDMILKLHKPDIHINLIHHEIALGKKATIHQVTTMLSTSKNVLFPGHNHLLTIGADDPSL